MKVSSHLLKHHEKKYVKKTYKEIKKSMRKKNYWYNSIAIKLILSFMIPVLFVILVGITSYKNASDTIVYNYETSCLQSIDMTTKYVELGLDSVKSIAVKYVSDDNFQNFFSNKLDTTELSTSRLKRDMKSTLVMDSSANDFIENITVMSEEAGAISTYSKWEEDLYTQFTNSEGGKPLAEKNSSAYWIGKDETIDRVCRVDANSYGVRFVQGFLTTKAAVVIDISASKIKSILNNLDCGNDSTVAFITKDGIELLSDSSVKEGQESVSLYQEQFYKDSMASEDTSNYKSISFHGEKYVYLYSKIGETGTMLCSLIPEKTITDQVKSIKNTTTILVIIACILAIIIGILISSSIQKTVKYIINKLKKVSSGDLTIEVNVKRKDEFHTLGMGINEMIVSMNGLIRQVRGESIAITESSAKVNDSSGVFAKASENIKGVIGEIEQGITQQAEDAQDCLIQMDNLASKIEVVYGKTNEINAIANNTSTCISKGLEIIQTLNEKAQSTSDITKKIVFSIVMLQEKSQTISKITETISEIAERSNLLSLNASIEAARAGQLGQGFAVVAEEIRNLSVQSVDAVHSIKELVNSIQMTTEEVVGIVGETQNIVVEQESAVNNTEEAFEMINHHVGSLIDNMDAIIESISNIEDSKNKTLESIQNITAVSEETASSSMEVSETTAKQLEVVKTLKDLSVELDNKAKSLEKVIQQFSIE